MHWRFSGANRLIANIILVYGLDVEWENRVRTDRLSSYSLCRVSSPNIGCHRRKIASWFVALSDNIGYHRHKISCWFVALSDNIGYHRHKISCWFVASENIGYHIGDQTCRVSSGVFDYHSRGIHGMICCVGCHRVTPTIIVTGVIGWLIIVGVVGLISRCFPWGICCASCISIWSCICTIADHSPQSTTTSRPHYLTKELKSQGVRSENTKTV